MTDSHRRQLIPQQGYAVLLFGRNASAHRPWVVFVLAATAASILWYIVYAQGSSAWPGGSSVPGFVFGVVGGLICTFEFLLWPRKKLRRLRLGTARWWMKAHIWLGLLSVPVLVLHSGFRVGGPLTTTLSVVFLLVIASGVWGLILQNIFPRRMLQDVPGETIWSQIGAVMGHHTRNADEVLQRICTPPAAAAGVTLEQLEVPTDEAPREAAVEVVRSVGEYQGKVLLTRVAAANVPGTEPLYAFFRAEVAPYLLDGEGPHSSLGNRLEAGRRFQQVRARTPDEARAVVGMLEELCELRRQLDHQARIHARLHNWMAVHLMLSVALMVLMAAHIWTALRYW